MRGEKMGRTPKRFRPDVYQIDHLNGDGELEHCFDCEAFIIVHGDGEKITSVEARLKTRGNTTNLCRGVSDNWYDPKNGLMMSEENMRPWVRTVERLIYGMDRHIYDGALRLFW